MTIKKGMICFDMDGTLADLYNVPNWLEKLRNEDATPYLDAAPLWNMDELTTVLWYLIDDGWEVRIISWLAKDSSEKYKQAVRTAKLTWLKKFQFPLHATHLVAYGTTKADCIRRYKMPAILIDDNKKVCDGWSLGQTINPQTTNIIKKLWELADRA